jgi:PAS domain S-box-containing protein
LFFYLEKICYNENIRNIMAYNFFPFIHFTAFVIQIFLVFYLIKKDYKSLLNRSFVCFFIFLAVWSFGYVFIHNHYVSRETAIFFMNFSAIGWILTVSSLVWISLAITEKKINSSFFVLTLIPFVFFLVLQWKGFLLYDPALKYYGWSFVFNFNFPFSLLWMAYYILVMLVVFYNIGIYIEKTDNEIKRKKIEKVLASSLFFAIFPFVIDIILPAAGIRLVPASANILVLLWILAMMYIFKKYKISTVSTGFASENIISTMSESLFLADIEGNIQHVNKAFLELTGYKKEEVIKQPINKFFDKVFVDYLFKSVFHIKNIDNRDICILSKKNKKIPVYFSSSVLTNKDGDAIGIVGIIKDISLFKEKNEKLRIKASELQLKIAELNISKEKMAQALNELSLEKNKIDIEKNKIFSIISNIKDPVIFIDNSYKIKIFNYSAQEILNLDQGAIGQKVNSLKNFSLNNFSQLINRKHEIKQIEDEQGRKYEELSVDYKGKEMVYNVITIHASNEKNHFGYVKLFYDITRERAINKIKSEFISIAAHQLRTPLAAIKWVIEMVLNEDAGKLNKDQKELLAKGYKSNERVIELVNDLLKVSRIEEGRFGFEIKEENFVGLVDEILTNYENEIKSKFIKFEYIKPQAEISAEIDKEKVSLAINNLIDNAVKYTPENGTIKICIKKDGDYVSFKIYDNGVGISSEDKMKLFSKFFRGSNVIRMQTEGSGLGLFIVKKIIDYHKGDIKIISKEGKGTEVSVLLPIKI